MNSIKKIVILISLFFTGFSTINAQCILLENGDSITCQKALNNMFDSIYHLEHVKFEMVSYERIEGVLQKNSAMAYVQYEPKKIFLRGFRQNGELANEILYIEGQNNNKTLISPNGFPYINLNLDPLGSTMRHNRHLTILDAGGRYLVDMLKLGLKQYKESGDSTNRFYITREGPGLLKLVVSNPDYEFKPYSVLQNEQIREIAFKLGIPGYKLIEINKEVDDFEDLSEGQVILIPNFYAKKFELIIREKDFVPMHINIFDDLGLYSSYDYIYFDTHPIINNQTFNSDNPAYTF